MMSMQPHSQKNATACSLVPHLRLSTIARMRAFVALVARAARFWGVLASTAMQRLCPAIGRGR